MIRKLLCRLSWIASRALQTSVGNRTFAGSAALVILAAINAISGPAMADSLSLQGSTVFNSRLIEPHRAAIEARTQFKLNVIPSKSIHGLVALVDGRADVAMISSALAEELEVLRQFRPAFPLDGLTSTTIARTRVAFAVHPENPVRVLTLEQVRGILLGDINRWSDVGGEGLDIIKVTVQPGGGVPSTVRRQLLDGKPFAASRLVQVEASPHVIKIVAQERAAIGITQLGLISGSRVRELATDHPIEQHLNLVTLGTPDVRQKVLIEALKTIAVAPLF